MTVTDREVVVDDVEASVTTAVRSVAGKMMRVGAGHAQFAPTGFDHRCLVELAMPTHFYGIARRGLTRSPARQPVRRAASHARYDRCAMPLTRKPRTSPQMTLASSVPCSRCARPLAISACRAHPHSWARPTHADPIVTCFPHVAVRQPCRSSASPRPTSSVFRRAGVPLQRIRPAVAALSKEIGIAHALASERLYTDGAEVLYDYATEHDEEHLSGLTVVRTGQREFAESRQGLLEARHLRHRRMGYQVRGFPPTSTPMPSSTQAEPSACPSSSTAAHAEDLRRPF